MSGKISMEQLDKAWKNTKKHGPQWSMAGKPAMISGAAVPSWVKSIPGPKYNVDTDTFKHRSPSWKFRPLDESKKAVKKSESAPANLPTAEELDKAFEATRKTVPKWTLGLKPEMISGDAVPSWVKSIPGPKYDPDIDVYKKKPPRFSIGTKLDMVIGGVIPSWINSIPGPKYSYNTDDFKNRQPVYTIGTKLKTEGEIMSLRSPGPIYGGSAIDAKAQANVDSTKRRTPAPSFGTGPRWEGKTYDMILSGALARYESGKFAF
jgi:hypothetical protein